MNLSGLIHKAIDFSTSNRAAILFFIICLLVTVWVRKSGYEGYQFGQEIGNVSAALASGEGFADVFDLDSGPTAWTPAFYTFIYALVFVIFGIKSVYSYWALFVLRCVLLAITFHLALRLNYTERLNRYKFLLLPIFLVYAYFVILRRGMDDVIFNVFLSMLLVYAISRFLEEGFTRVKALFYGLAIIVPLSNISLFIALFLLVIVTRLSSNLPRIPISHAVALMTLMVLSVTGWGIRNQRVLNQFIPFKSNLWFELYLSNVADEDGILKFTNFREYHPLSNESVKQQYKTLGETKFLENYKVASIEYLSQNTGDFLEKIVNRAYSVFLWTQFDIDNVEPANQDIPAEDVYKLESAGLILNGEWTCIDMKPKAFQAAVNGLDLSQLNMVLEDWSTRKAVNKKDKLNYKNLILGLLMSLLPFLALLCGLIFKPLRCNRTFLVTLILFLLTIGPYMIISIHTRYQLFQMSYFVIFIFLALAFLMDRFLPKLIDKETGAI